MELEIKVEMKKDKDGIFSVEVDCMEYHYAKYSRDEQLILGIYKAAEMMKLGLKSKLIKYEE